MQLRGELVVIHYHFRPGGVRRVIERVLPELAGAFRRVRLLGGERPPREWVRGLKVAGIEVCVEEAFGYLSEQGVDVAGVRGRIRAALERWCGPGSVIWGHNLALGRNMILAGEVGRHSARAGVRVVSHHHDFWCDNRWGRWPEMRAWGVRTLREVAAAAFSARADVVHVAINSADERLLAANLPGVRWLPNPAESIGRPSREGVRRAVRWLREEVGCGARYWIYPARFLRRKNFAEAVLLTRWLQPEGWLVTTGGVSSAGEEEYARRLREAARAGRWRVKFGVLANRRRPTVEELICGADAVVMTSIQEGFGFPYLEGAGLGRRVVARRLPVIEGDLQRYGVEVPGLYDEVMVPLEMFDWRAEAGRQERLFREWRQTLPGVYRREAGGVFSEDGAVAFSRLTLAGQLEVLRVPAEESLAGCLGWNSWLGRQLRSSTDGSASRPYRRGAGLSARDCAARWFEAAEVEGDRPTVNEAVRAQDAMARERLGVVYPLLME